MSHGNSQEFWSQAPCVWDPYLAAPLTATQCLCGKSAQVKGFTWQRAFYGRSPYFQVIFIFFKTTYGILFSKKFQSQPGLNVFHKTCKPICATPNFWVHCCCHCTPLVKIFTFHTSDDTIPTKSFTPGAAPNVSEILLVNNAISLTSPHHYSHLTPFFHTFIWTSFENENIALKK